MTDYAPSGVAQSPSGEAQLYLPQITRRVPRSVHDNFHADWTKTVGARGIETDKQTDIDSLIDINKDRETDKELDRKRDSQAD